ncbi:MAG: hypothetical protein DWH81_03010 [Planctomycetota bacterium]|nr:MAG: hypothetical protein DWH81_03010 [Planctomycetota bacterium]
MEGTLAAADVRETYSESDAEAWIAALSFAGMSINTEFVSRYREMRQLERHSGEIYAGYPSEQRV